MTFFNFYNTFATTHGFKVDKQQQSLCHLIDKTLTMSGKHSFLKKIWLIITFQKQEIPMGLYIYGPVGTGKTTIMDLFFNYQSHKSHRDHFKTFMLDLHKNGYEQTIKNYKSLHFIFLDELEIIDIADAMIIKRLFIDLNQYHVKIITTSNQPPQNLYKNGLHFDRFEPFIPYIQKKYILFNLDKAADYRKTNKKEFDSIRNNHKTDNTTYTVKIMDKSIPCKSYKKGILIDFNDLLNTSCGPLHFNELSKKQPTLYINNIPSFNKNNKDALRRFISLADIYYDQKNKIKIIPTPDLFITKDINLPTERLQSRLIEMS